MRKELQDRLYEKYPEIFKNKDGDSKETLMCFGICCGDGWYFLINNLCKSIKNYVEWKNRVAKPEEDQCGISVVAEQVKQKYGSLRFYVNGGDDYVHGLIAMAESMSKNICEHTGNFGIIRGHVRLACTSFDNAKRCATQEEIDLVYNRVLEMEKESAENISP
jgi:hypothetical protein